jgi:penicillin-binding protein 2
MSRISDESQDFDARLSAIRAVALVVFVVLGVRFWGLQVVNHESYAIQAERNRTRDIPIPAPRGNILDRNKKILVDSRPTFSLKVNREDLKKHELKELLDILHEHLGVDPDYAAQQINDPLAPKSRPVTIKPNLTDSDRAWVEAHELEYPELYVDLEPQRIYPLGPVLAHVLGYVGQISPGQLNAKLPEFAGASSGDIVGQSGIERSHNQLLMGREGTRRVIVDSAGRFVDELERIEPVPGQDLITTIDLDLQQLAEEQLAATKLKGTIVLLDPRNGEILAMVSQPSYDPNVFSSGISKDDYAKLANDESRPLRNRAIQDIYPPGSTWKLVMAMAGLSEKAMTADEGVACGGGIQSGNRFAACHGSHGAPNVERALAVSCNGYFYRVGVRLGPEKIHRWATAMGLGKKTGIDLPNETAGYVPDEKIKLRWKIKNHPNDDDPIYRWTQSDTINASIGQGYDRPTPLQMVHAFGGIGMNGHFTTPHLLLKALGNSVRQEVTFKDPNVVDIPLEKHTFDAVMKGLRAVVTSGTARRAEVPGFEVGGKTGTAQVISLRTGASGRFKEHAWFCAIAPMPDAARGLEPEIAAVVLVENGGHGGTTCAPIAQALFTAYAQKAHPEMLAGGKTEVTGESVGADPDAAALLPESADEVQQQADSSQTGDTAIAAPTLVRGAAATDAPEGEAPAPLPAAGVNPLQGVLKGPEDQESPPAGPAKRPKRSG